MSKVKRKTSHRLLAAFLSFVMAFSLIPISMVSYAATTEHPDSFTVSVKDTEGNPVTGGKVVLTNSNTTWDLELEAEIDANGLAVFESTEIQSAYQSATEAGTLVDGENALAETYAEVSGYTYGETNVFFNSSDEDSFAQHIDLTIESTVANIEDVEIAGKTLTYTGEAQELVSVTKVEGDTIEYYLNGATEPMNTIPTEIYAGTYSVRVVVNRTGYTALDKTVETVIEPADIEGIDIVPVNGLKYNEADQALVTLTGDFAEGDNVTWTVNDIDTGTKDIPKEMAVGEYEVKLTVDRGANYKIFEKIVNVEIELGDIDLGDLNIEPNNRTYDATEQPLLTVTKGGDYTLEYSTDNQATWNKDTIPVATDAGKYLIYVKATKDNYNDKETSAFPITVNICKKDQSFDFVEYDAMGDGTNPEVIELQGVVPYGQTYDFSAIDIEALANGEITYDIEADEDVAEIAIDGTLTINHPGAITVIAKLSGNANYNECIIKYYLEVNGGVSSNGDYIEFAETEKNYVIGTSDTISEQKATKKNKWISGNISYSINDVEGVSINSESGELAITDIDKLVEVVRGGNNEIIVTAKKEATRRYGADEVSYKVIVSFETTPANPYTLSAVDGTNDWYKTKATVTPVDGYEIAQKASDTFGATTEFSNQGTDVRYVYLRNATTGGITDRIEINIKIDSVTPTELTIKFSELNLVQKLGQSLGFYNPTVAIIFTAKDVTSGIDHFDWTYTPEFGAAVTKEIAVDVDETTKVATATLTLPAEQAEQMHGKISFTATDEASNEIGKTDDYVFIVDTIEPELSVNYQGEKPYTAQEAVYNGAHFFNSDVNVELTITETNFYAEDVSVKVSKDGADATEVTPSWNDKVGTFTLTGDGDYVVYVTYIDRANNKMADYASEIITVDKVDPSVNIEYVHDDDVQKTIFTVTEHNFRASDVVITGTMKDIKGDDVAFTAVKLTEILNNATWTQNGDIYTYEYDQYVNGIYNLKMDYTDIAGRKANQAEEPEFIIDHDGPTEPTIEYITTPWETFLNVITFGYYNPSVKVRFTSYDTSSGVKSFTWGYAKENGASTINHPDTIEDTTIDAGQDQNDNSKFTAEITLTAEEAAQYRGYLSVLATDVFQNNSVKKVDNGNIIVVDTIAPEITVEYNQANRESGNEYYYNKAINVKFTVTEANFYAEDVVVSVTKNGVAFDYGKVNWGSRNAKDRTIGTFTLPAPNEHSGDGHYVITVEYTDRSNNKMTKYVSGTHTIDTTLPIISVDYKNKNVAKKVSDRDGNKRKYFADTQTAEITIKEHNFISDEVDFTIVAKDVTGKNLDADTLSKKSSWSVDSTGDIHTITIKYPGDANYTFDIAYTDKAENEAEDYVADYFTVDKTKPKKLSVEYSTSILETVLESLSFGFYNAKMTVTLNAEDTTSEVDTFIYSYLNAAGVSDVNAELDKKTIKSVKYSDDRKKATASFEIPKMVLGNDNQFNGTVEFTATDRAGNTTKDYKETKRIVVDNIAPTAQVTYNEATNVVGGTSYYNGNINATITINEANFYADDVQVMVSKDGGTATAVDTTWNDNSVDVHVGTFTLTEDGDYIVTINYTDKSSNEMATYTSEKMTIDTKIEEPTYTINGNNKTEVGGAYKGEAKISFNFADQNFETKTIKLTRTRYDKVEDVTEKFIKGTDNDKGGYGSFTIPNEVENDGIYVLKISMLDRAKHETESEMKFTINRYGSVYEYNNDLVNLIKDGGQYIKSVEDDLVITEYNADRILEDSLQILVTRDGETVDVDYTSTPENINDQVDVGESGWYQYIYTVKAANFEKDGVYKISLTSKYAADDSDENDSTSVPENSIDEQGNKILDTMNFTVDSVAPEIRNIVNLDKKIADKDKIVDGKLNVKYTIVDVGGLNTIDIIVNDEAIQTLTAEDIADNAYNFTGSFDLAEQNGTSAHKVQIKVTDLAGNVTDTNSEDFLKAHSGDNENSTYAFYNQVTVSRNFFVRWYANTLLFWGFIVGVVVIAGGICFIIATKKKKMAIN